MLKYNRCGQITARKLSM